MRIENIKEAYKKIFYIEDDFSLDLTAAVVASTLLLKSDPIWVIIIGAPSSGKSELINAFSKVKFVYPVSDMTENTLLSGMANTVNEPSFLKQMGTYGCIAMKDYTSILSMRAEKRSVILGQLREVYDGSYEKKTGNGKNPSWVGKANFIGGATEAIYAVEEESASMGRRNIHYVLPEQDRIQTARIARKNRQDDEGIKLKRAHLQNMITEYMEELSKALPTVLPSVPEEISENLIELADFATQARTPAHRNFKRQLTLATSKEMPMRMSEQLHMLGEIFIYLYEGILNEQQEWGLYKIALDSIPKQKLMALKFLATYNSSTTKGLALPLKYPTDTVREWLEDLNVLNLIDREPGKDKKGKTTQRIDVWKIKPRYRDLIFKYCPDLERIEKDVLLDEDDAESYDPGYVFQERQEVDAAFEEATIRLQLGVEPTLPEGGRVKPSE